MAATAAAHHLTVRGLRMVPSTAANGSTCLLRGIATTSTRSLPRQVVRRAPSSELPLGAQRRAVPRPAAATEQQSDVPWYLREQEGYDEEPETSVSAQKDTDPADLEPNIALPTPLRGLHQLLTEGAASPLIARPDEGQTESETGRRPLTYIHARQADPQSWCDWIVIVQVRSSAGATVSRVAKEVGEYLRDRRPPMDAETLAAAQRSFAMKETGLSQSGAAERTSGEDLTPTGKRPWRPYKILSREAQEGMRLLHANDPERWSRKALAETFRMSVESVRRILRSKWRPTSDVVSRQNRRARERQEERRQEYAAQSWQAREQEEIARIRASMQESNADQAEASDEDVPSEYRLVDEHGTVVDEGSKSHKQPIFYEGLVSSGQEGSSQPKASSRARTGLARGDGEWCLVDAGWCVVHVMTAKARNTYDVESQYDVQGHRTARFRTPDDDF